MSLHEQEINEFPVSAILVAGLHVTVLTVLADVHEVSVNCSLPSSVLQKTFSPTTLFSGILLNAVPRRNGSLLISIQNNNYD